MTAFYDNAWKRILTCLVFKTERFCYNLVFFYNGMPAGTTLL